MWFSERNQKTAGSGDPRDDPDPHVTSGIRWQKRVRVAHGNGVFPNGPLISIPFCDAYYFKASSLFHRYEMLQRQRQTLFPRFTLFGDYEPLTMRTALGTRPASLRV